MARESRQRMRVDTDKIKWLLENYTQYRVAKETGVSQSTLSSVINGTRKVENLTIEVGSKLTKYAEEQIKQTEEENKMKQEQLLELIKKELLSMDEEIRDNLYDVYFQPSDNHILLTDAGMEYSGDDRDAYYVAQIEGQEVISWV